MTLAYSPPAVLLSPRDPEAAGRPLSTVEAAPAAVAVAPVAARSQRPVTDVVEDWGLASFPASDPPSNW